MKINYTLEARQDLRDIYEYITYTLKELHCFLYN